MINFDDLVSKLDLSDCVSIYKRNCNEPQSGNITIKRCSDVGFRYNSVTQQNDIATRVHCLLVLVNEERIGTMRFYRDVSDTFIFLQQLENRSIDRDRGEREYCKVGTTLIDCLKKIARHANSNDIFTAAITPVSTPLPKNHDIKLFFEKMAFVARPDFTDECLMAFYSEK